MNIEDKFDKQLLIDKILAQARGVQEISELSLSLGEVIHIDEREIKSIKAKKENIDYSCYNGINRKLIKFF